MGAVFAALLMPSIKMMGARLVTIVGVQVDFRISPAHVTEPD